MSGDAAESAHVKPGASEGAPGPGTVTLQARVDAVFARELLEVDAAVLGLHGASEIVREGLRLLHQQARELAMAHSYDEFYDDQPAPVSDVTSALWSE